MKNEKNKTNKKAITIRIQKDILDTYNNKLENIYKTNHRKQSATIETLLNQFNRQDNKKLRTYLEQDKQLINLNDDKITQYQAQLQEKEQEIKILKERITEKENIIIDKKQHHQEMQESLKKRYNQKIQSLKETIDEKNKTISDKDKTISIQQETINTLNDEKTQLNKDVRTARNDYKHSMENLNKLHDEFNDVQNENKKYAVTFAEIKKMSLIERILSKYPDDIKELPD